jgi:hypothetical protein
MTCLGASVGNSLGESAGAGTGSSRHPVPAWKLGVSAAAMIGDRGGM